MALELSTIGIQLKYCAEATAGTRPTTGYTQIANITSIGEISSDPDQLDVTNLEDTWRRYIAGVKDTGGNVTIGANFTAAFKTAWETAITAYSTAFAAGKAIWWEVVVPNFGSFYFSGEPTDMGLPSIEVNNVFAGEVNIIPNTVEGWATSST